MNRQVRRTVAELKQRLEAVYGARLSSVIVYGSHARGDADPYSDIDVLVVLKSPVYPGTEIARVGPMIADLSLNTDSVITPLFMDEEHFLSRAGPLLRNIRREGVTL